MLEQIRPPVLTIELSGEHRLYLCEVCLAIRTPKHPRGSEIDPIMPAHLRTVLVVLDPEVAVSLGLTG